MQNDKKKLIDALWKRAVGYSVTETIDDCVVENGQLVHTKQRTNTKDIPPDLSAIKLLLEEMPDELDSMTEEELTAEKERLLKLLAGYNT